MKGKKLNYYILIIPVALVILGVLMIASVSAPFSQERFGYPSYYLKRQVLYGIIPGAVLCFILFKIPLNFLKRRVLPLFLLSLILIRDLE